MRFSQWLMAGVMLAGAAAPVRAADRPDLRQAPIFVIANAAPNILGTTAIKIRAERFRDNLSRALKDASQSPLMQRLVGPARGLNRLQQLAYVQSRVQNNIRWISDTTEWGRHDYWASAADTLAHGAGDMDNRAIVKMHALRALGFNPGDLFLTLARDRVGGPMTVLTARVNGRYFILDDTGGKPFLVETRSREFQPVLSFGWNGTWVHTKPASTIAMRAGSGLRANK